MAQLRAGGRLSASCWSWHQEGGHPGVRERPGDHGGACPEHPPAYLPPPRPGFPLWPQPVGAAPCAGGPGGWAPLRDSWCGFSSSSSPVSFPSRNQLQAQTPTPAGAPHQAGQVGGPLWPAARRGLGPAVSPFPSCPGPQGTAPLVGTWWARAPVEKSQNWRDGGRWTDPRPRQLPGASHAPWAQPWSRLRCRAPHGYEGPLGMGLPSRRGSGLWQQLGARAAWL